MLESEFLFLYVLVSSCFSHIVSGFQKFRIFIVFFFLIKKMVIRERVSKFCLTYDQSHCLVGYSMHKSFYIHENRLTVICMCMADGLWPDYNDGTWPACCTRKHFDEKEVCVFISCAQFLGCRYLRNISQIDEF